MRCERVEQQLQQRVWCMCHHRRRRAWCTCDRLHYYSEGDDTAARARARCRGGCSCEQRPDWYYRFTLEGEAPPPPLAAD